MRNPRIDDNEKNKRENVAGNIHERKGVLCEIVESLFIPIEMLRTVCMWQHINQI